MDGYCNVNKHIIEYIYMSRVIGGAAWNIQSKV